MSDRSDIPRDGATVEERRQWQAELALEQARRKLSPSTASAGEEGVPGRDAHKGSSPLAFPGDPEVYVPSAYGTEDEAWRRFVLAQTGAIETPRLMADMCCDSCRELTGEGPWCPRCGVEMPGEPTEWESPWSVSLCDTCDVIVAEFAQDGSVS